MFLLAVPVLAAWALVSSALFARHRFPSVQVASQEPLGPMVPTFRVQPPAAPEEHHYTHAA